MAKRRPMPSPEEIAAFYSGGNMKGPITWDYTNSMGTTGLPGSGNIRLNPKLKEGYEALRKYGPRSQQGVVLGSFFLSTLIHEALHNRAGFEGFDPEEEIGPTDLGIRLVPDAMQRFFGIPIDSKWGKKYLEATMKRLRP